MGSHYSRLEVLGRRLRSLSDEERSDAAKSLGREDPHEVIELVRTILSETEHMIIQRDAVSAIAYTRADPALDALVEFANDLETDPELRAQALEGLGYIVQFKSRGHPRYDEIAEMFVALLRDPEPIVRLWAAQAIGVAGVKRARQRLIELAIDDNDGVDDRCWGTVRDEARAALHALKHRRDLMWPVLQAVDRDTAGAIRTRVLTYLKDLGGPITAPAPAADDEEALDPEAEAERQLLEAIIVRQDRMPIFDSKEGRFSITPEAAVFFTPHDGGTRRERRPRWLIVSIKAASKNIPELANLLPSRPDTARDCDTCKGKGKVLRPWRRVGPYCDGCWGLGWTMLPEVTKDDLVRAEEEEEFADSDDTER
jgi:hypothetical protein